MPTVTAVLVNAVYIVKQRVDKIGRPTGMDTNNILVVSSSGFTRDYDTVGAIRDDLAYIRGVPGVIAAAAINSIPLSSAGSARTIANGACRAPVRNSCNRGLRAARRGRTGAWARVDPNLRNLTS